MKLSRHKFSTEIAGTRYYYAERTFSEIEVLNNSEKAALEAADWNAVKSIHIDFVLKAMNDAGEEVTVDDLKNNMGTTTFNNLFNAVLAAQSLKLDAKTTPGERKPSQTS